MTILNHKKYTLLLLIVFTISFFSCEEDPEPYSKITSITLENIDSSEEDYEATITKPTIDEPTGTVKISIPYIDHQGNLDVETGILDPDNNPDTDNSINFNEITFKTFEISREATIEVDTDEKVDFYNERTAQFEPVKYTVIAEDGTSSNYIVEIELASASTASELIDFEIENLSVDNGDIEIGLEDDLNNADGIIKGNLDYGREIDVTVLISDKASVTIKADTTEDGIFNLIPTDNNDGTFTFSANTFIDRHNYIDGVGAIIQVAVTAEDGITTSIYTMTIESLMP